MVNLIKKLIITSLFIGMAGVSAYADDDWYISTTVSGALGGFDGAVERDNFDSKTLLVTTGYLDRFSATFAYNNFNLNYKNASVMGADLSQDMFSGRIQYNFFSNSLGGKITTQLAVHAISNDDVTNFTDDVEVYAPKIAYTNFNKDLYLGLEYSKSKYKNTSLTVKQVTPTIGFGFNQNADWLHIKVNLIKPSDKNLSQGESSLTSVSVKWLHWMGPNAPLGIDNFFVNAVAGQQIYAVDNDALLVYNLDDIHKGSFSTGLGWKLGENFNINAALGVDRYENKVINDNYKLGLFSLSLTKNW